MPPPPALSSGSSAPSAERRRAVGIVRVSKEGGRGDDLMSPAIQRTAIDGYCRTVGATVVEWIEAVDESGSQAKSAWWARLDTAVEMIERGDADLLVGWKFSRAARNRARWAVAVDRVETAGGLVVSATEGVDVTTSTGRFTRGMLAELAAFQAETTGETWREVHDQRTARGLTHNGRRRFGYQLDAQRVHQPDPITGPVLAEAYRRYTDGDGVHSLVLWLNAHGHPTTTGARWTDRTLRRVLDDGFAAGLIRVRGTLQEGAHTPLLTRAEWDAYLAARAARARRAPQSQHSRYLLSGLLTCGWCGGAMTAGTFGEARSPQYRCETRRAAGPTACARGGYVSAARVHDGLLRHLQDVAGRVDAAAADSAAETVPAAAGQAARVAEAQAAEVARLDRLLVKLTQAHLEDDGSDEAVFRMTRDDYRDRRAKALLAQREAEHAARVVNDETPNVVQPLIADWHTLGVEARRETLRTLYVTVRVFKQPGRAVPPVVEPVPHPA